MKSYKVIWTETRDNEYTADVLARNEEHARRIIEEDLDYTRVSTDEDVSHLVKIKVHSVQGGVDPKGKMT